ncbi:MAG: phage portal protein [Acidobacteriota bacterium]
MNEHIDEAIANFRRQYDKYAKPERYYAGMHDLAFATDKFKSTFGTLFREFALNLCPAICDAVRDKLRITGFSVDTADTFSTDASKKQVRRIWNDNRMRTRAGEVHKEALKCGDAYMIVWPNAAGDATLYPNRAASCSVIYDDELPGRIVRAAKYWQAADKRVCLNLYYIDRIEKYVSKVVSEGSLPDASAFVSSAVIPNPFGVVPVFHFGNNADLGDPGRSELAAAIPIQDGLNKSVLDMLVAMEYAAFRQRWAAGIETDYDAQGKPVAPFTAGVEQIWMSENPNAKFGDFNTANLEQFLRVKDSFRVDIALVTGTPLHYFTPNITGTRSSDSLRRSESRFIAKVRDRQESFGQVWSDVMSFALAIEGHGRSVRLLTEWEDPAPLSDREFLENILLKKQIGLPAADALIEAGYGQADAEKFAHERRETAPGGSTRP